MLALLSASTGGADAKPEPAGPIVRIAQLSPLVVQGERFRPRQRILIRVGAHAVSHKRTMRATRRGTFAARFAGVSYDRCGGSVSVVVTTATGLVAKTRMPLALCPPALP